MLWKCDVEKYQLMCKELEADVEKLKGNLNKR